MTTTPRITGVDWSNGTSEANIRLTSRHVSARQRYTLSLGLFLDHSPRTRMSVLRTLKTYSRPLIPSNSLSLPDGSSAGAGGCVEWSWRNGYPGRRAGHRQDPHRPGACDMCWAEGMSDAVALLPRESWGTTFLALDTGNPHCNS